MTTNTPPEFYEILNEVYARFDVSKMDLIKNSNMKDAEIIVLLAASVVARENNQDDLLELIYTKIGKLAFQIFTTEFKPGAE